MISHITKDVRHTHLLEQCGAGAPGQQQSDGPVLEVTQLFGGVGLDVEDPGRFPRLFPGSPSVGGGTCGTWKKPSSAVKKLD